MHKGELGSPQKTDKSAERQRTGDPARLAQFRAERDRYIAARKYNETTAKRLEIERFAQEQNVHPDDVRVAIDLTKADRHWRELPEPDNIEQHTQRTLDMPPAAGPSHLDQQPSSSRIGDQASSSTSDKDILLSIDGKKLSALKKAISNRMRADKFNPLQRDFDEILENISIIRNYLKAPSQGKEELLPNAIGALNRLLSGIKEIEGDLGKQKKPINDFLEHCNLKKKSIQSSSGS
jgi:hypothetical protein